MCNLPSEMIKREGIHKNWDCGPRYSARWIQFIIYYCGGLLPQYPVKSRGSSGLRKKIRLITIKRDERIRLKILFHFFYSENIIWFSVPPLAALWSIAVQKRRVGAALQLMDVFWRMIGLVVAQWLERWIATRSKRASKVSNPAGSWNHRLSYFISVLFYP